MATDSSFSCTDHGRSNTTLSLTSIIFPPSEGLKYITTDIEIDLSYTIVFTLHGNIDIGVNIDEDHIETSSCTGLMKRYIDDG